jgi:hypothetical protein
MQPLVVQFGEWSPDDDRNISPGTPSPYLNAQTVPLEDALNVLYTGSAWRLFAPLATAGTALAASPSDAVTVSNAGALVTFAQANGHLYKIAAGVITDVSKAGNYTAGQAWDFEQFGSCLLATNGVDPVQDFDVGTSSAFADLAGSPPKAYVVGKVRDFVVLGNTTDGTGNHPYRVQWSGIANPTSWPAPLTQAARAAQSGYQDNYSEYGKVQYIAQGEEFGLIFQERGIVRMQYVGGDVVFQFYTFERKRGLVTPKAAAQIGSQVYFLSGDGFYATDGTEVQPIGYGKVNRWFLANCYDLSKVRAAVDSVTQCVYWTFPSTSSGISDSVIVYNFAEARWSHAQNTTYALFQGLSGSAHIPQAFDAANKVGGFTGAQTGAVIETKTFRLQPNMRSLVSGARALADDVAQIAVAATQTDDDPVVFGSFAARGSRSRMSPLRANGYAHAFKASLGAATTYAQGLEIVQAARSRM